MCKEVWKSVRNYPNYEVSNLGRIRSYFYFKILNPSKNSSKYYFINLYSNQKRKSFFIHVLIAEAFLGPRPDGYVCNHKDGNKLNNNIDNLEWISKSDDRNHAYRLGLISTSIKFGEKVHSAKLKNNEVWLIKKLLFYSIGQKIIAKMFKVSRSCIGEISRESVWKHIKYED